MTENFSIRPLTPTDEPFLWDMLYHAIHVSEGQSPPPRSIVNEPTLAHYVRDWGQQPGDLGVIAVDPRTHQPVGAAWLRRFSHLDPGYGFVDDQTPELSIALLPGYRGQGLGSRLLTALLKAAEGKTAAISLSVSKDNPARQLYERLGFEVVADDDASGDDSSSLTMLKRFKS